MSQTISSEITIPGFSWSYSQLKNYETCPRRYYHYSVARDVVEPESEALRKGHEVHAAFDRRVRKKTPLPESMAMYEPLLIRLAGMAGQTKTEQKLALDADLAPSSWRSPTTWFRIMLDFVNIKPTKRIAAIIDYKTGKPDDDLTQLQLSAATVFAYHPGVEVIRAALMFINHDEVEQAEYTRNDITEIWSEVLPRVRKLVQARQAESYPPRPGGLCRRYCAVVSCPFNGK